MRTRLTSRILVLDETNRLLLFLTKGSVPAQQTRWITPGGGVDPGETHHDAACRELFEETGMVADDLGEAVSTDDFAVDYPGGDHDAGHVEFYLLRTMAFTPSSDNWTPEEHGDILEHRWWSIDDLRTTTEPYEPTDLPDLIAQFSGDAGV